MGYALQLAALALVAVGVRLFEMGPTDPESGFGRHMLVLGAIAAVSTTLSLLALVWALGLDVVGRMRRPTAAA